jgi:Outer membrane protein beta-barrel domain
MSANSVLRWASAVALVFALEARGQEESLVRRYSVGPRFTVAPGVFIPSNGSAGFSLGLEGGYGFDLGPVIVTPGLSLQGNWSSDWTVYSGLAGGRVTFPFGSFGPFVEAGLGYGHVSGPLNYSAGGLAVRGGVGFTYFFSPQFALGLSVRYDTIVDTAFKGWTFAPTLLIGF